MDSTKRHPAEIVLTYFQGYYANPRVPTLYTGSARGSLYRRIGEIIQTLGVSCVLDVGCSIGKLVELLSANGIVAFGVDLDIPQIRAAHRSLHCADKFRYCSFLDVAMPKAKSAVVVLDTLRYLPQPRSIADVGAQFIIVKEVSSGPWGRYLRRNEFQVGLYSPANIRRIFPDYRVRALYGPGLRFRLPRFALHAANLMPSYTIILERKKDGSNINRCGSNDTGISKAIPTPPVRSVYKGRG